MGKISEESFKEIAQRFVDGEPIRNLCDEYCVTYSTLWERLKKHGYERPRNSDPTLKHDVFKVLNEEVKYWLGILLTDGNVYKRLDSLTSRLQLKLKDLEHIEKFKNFLNTSNKIAVINREDKQYYQISITSNEIIQDIAEYHIVPKKTFTAKVHKYFLTDKHFYRGLIDGDGSVAIYANKAYIDLCGTYDIVYSYLQWVKSFVDTKVEIRKFKNIYRVELVGKSALPVIKELYQDATIYLDRKYEVAKQLLFGVLSS